MELTLLNPCGSSSPSSFGSKKLPILWRLRQPIDAHVIPARRWERLLHTDWRCSRCGRLDRQRGLKAVDVELAEPDSIASVGTVADTNIGLASADLVRALNLHEYGFLIGNCRDSRGRLVPQFKTVVCATALVEVGARGTQYYRCVECNTLFGDRVAPIAMLCYPVRDPWVYQGWNGGLFVSTALCTRVEWSHFPTVTLVDVPVTGVAPPSADIQPYFGFRRSE